VAAGVAVVLGLALLLVGAAPALGQGTGSQVRTEIEQVRPAVPEGVEIELVESVATELSVINRTDQVLEILDEEGQAFLRIGPDGVEADFNSPSWFRSNDPTGTGGVPERLADDPPARFVRIAEDPSWSLFDQRLNPELGASVPEDALGDGRREVTLADWAIGLRYGGREGAIEGRLFYSPLLGTLQQRLTSPQILGDAAFVQLLPGAVPGLFVDNGGEEPVTVLGRSGEPFARIGPEGVEVNVRSPSHVDDQRLRGESPEVAADADAEPLWRAMGDAPRYNWIEPRAAYGREQPPPDVVDAGESATVLEWAVPVRLAEGATQEITGRTTWVPTSPPGTQGDGGVPAALWVAAPLALLAALAGAFVARRRAGTPPAS
jgi:hypothetical protein